MLLIRPSGKKTWQYKFRFNGTEQLLMIIGQYPQISLVQARQALEQAKAMLANGINPATAKQESKAQQKAAQLNCFENVARDWHGKNIHKWKANHAMRIMHYLENDVFPMIGSKPIHEIKVSHIKSLLDMVKPIENRTQCRVQLVAPNPCFIIKIVQQVAPYTCTVFK